MHLDDFVYTSTDFEDKRVLDAATGVGGATVRLAERLAEDGGKEILSVDIDQEQDTVESIREDLDEKASFVTFIEDDIHSLKKVESKSIDIVLCDDTIIFLNRPPLAVLRAIKAFHRVLREGGELIIVSELPDTPDASHTGEWRRWHLAKALFELRGETFAESIPPETLKEALSCSGFIVKGEETSPGWMNTDYEHIIEEWEAIMHHEITLLPFEELKRPFREAVDRVKIQVEEDGYLDAPGKYAIKCIKQ